MLKKCTYNSQHIAHYAQVEPIKNLMLTETNMSRVHVNYENVLPIMLFSKNPQEVLFPIYAHYAQ